MDVAFPGPLPSRGPLRSIKNDEIFDNRMMVQAQHWCQICTQDDWWSGTTPRFRQTHNYRGAENRCANAACQISLCFRHILPQSRCSHAKTSFFGYCPPCYKERTRCTWCGCLGRDDLSVGFGEPAHWGKKTAQSLWVCGREGCTHLLCMHCGSSHDGCQIHARFHPCLIWDPRWGPRSWNGPVSPACPTIHPVTQVATAAHINPPQIDPPPLPITATEGVPLAALPDLVDLQWNSRSNTRWRRWR